MVDIQITLQILIYRLVFYVLFFPRRKKTAIGFAKATQMQAFALTKRTPLGEGECST